MTDAGRDVVAPMVLQAWDEFLSLAEQVDDCRRKGAFRRRDGIHDRRALQTSSRGGGTAFQPYRYLLPVNSGQPWPTFAVECPAAGTMFRWRSRAHSRARSR